MTLLPVKYFGVQVGFVRLDTPTYNLVKDLPWLIALPLNIAARRHSADVLVGLLKEDETLLPRCSIYMMLASRFKVRLPKLVLHLEVAPLLTEFLHLRNNPRKEILFHDIRSRLMSTGRVTHLDRDKTNCLVENLRELSYEPLEQPSNLYHED